MIRELTSLMAILEQFNNRVNKKIITNQEMIEGNGNIVELHDDLELLTEAISNSSDTNVSITETLVDLNRHVIGIINDVEDVQELVGFALNRYRGLKKMKLKND